MVNIICPTSESGWTNRATSYWKHWSTKREWWAREDSNLQPSGYEPLALTIELRARAAAGVFDET
jgi:hypothetical protein